jgi:hypothetical protein
MASGDDVTQLERYSRLASHDHEAHLSLGVGPNLVVEEDVHGISLR